MPSNESQLFTLSYQCPFSKKQLKASISKPVNLYGQCPYSQETVEEIAKEENLVLFDLGENNAWLYDKVLLNEYLSTQGRILQKHPVHGGSIAVINPSKIPDSSPDSSYCYLIENSFSLFDPQDGNINPSFVMKLVFAFFVALCILRSVDKWNDLSIVATAVGGEVAAFLVLSILQAMIASVNLAINNCVKAQSRDAKTTPTTSVVAKIIPITSEQLQQLQAYYPQSTHDRPLDLHRASFADSDEDSTPLLSDDRIASDTPCVDRYGSLSSSTDSVISIRAQRSPVDCQDLAANRHAIFSSANSQSGANDHIAVEMPGLV